MFCHCLNLLSLHTHDWVYKIYHMPKTLQAKQLMIHYTDEIHQAMLIFVLTGNICRRKRF